MLLLHSLLFSLVSSQDHDCPSPNRPAFIRSAGAIRLPPIVQAKLDMVTCANLCRRNAHPSSEATLPCKGFNFRVGRSPTCEFFSDIPFGAAEPRDYYFYFEKTCLQVPPRCEEATFVVDTKKGVRLRAESQSRIAFSQKECIQACFAEDCPAFEWDERLRVCRVYKKTRREYEAIRSEDVVYMENNCIPPSQRCPGARVDFLMARRSDVPSFGVSVGIRSIRGCIQECSDTTLFHCRSFQFDPLSSECFVSDESSEEAVPSKKLDLYEPFCSPESADVSCNRPYAYEKILTTKMAGAREITQHPNSGPEECLGHCSSQRGCHAVNYDVSRRVCHLLDRQRQQGTIGPDENFDFYESACPPAAKAVSSQPASSEFHLVTGDKSLIHELRYSSLSGIGTVEECFDSCKKTSFSCKSFSYNPSTRQCFLSTAIITGEAEQFESEPGSKVYAHDDVSLENNFLDESTTRYPTLVSVAAQLDASSEQNIFHMSSQELEDLTDTSQLETKTPIPTLLQSSALVRSEENSLESELGLMEPGAVPKVAPIESEMGFVDPSSVTVEAECFDNGVNITFTSGYNYTGAVYATERFEQCRILVTKKQKFAIFVTRPSHNTWCNALEFEGQLSVVLVMSNDRVWPLDVTTGKDLIYHISCNYSQSETLHRGIVVGGPSPIAVGPESVRHSISLQITRKGKPVSNVYIGEPLVALIKVESGVPAHNLRVVDCTAHRVGSTTGSIHLIADGCALLPSLMSSMVLSPIGWEATLSAFRVDDGEQVDIACMVAVCAPGQCSRNSCPPRTARSLVNQEAVRIDTRLSVHGNRTSQERGSLPAICVQPSIYISIILLLIVFACAALISLLTAITSNRRCRRSITDPL